MHRLIIFSIISLCCLANIEAKESVPLLIWKEEKLSLDTPVLAVSPHEIPISYIEEKYLQAFEPDNILFFEQDALSIEDFSSYDVFKNTKRMMNEYHSLYLPAVEGKTSIAHTLSAHGYNIMTLEPGGSSAGELKLKEPKNLVHVKLPSTITNPSRKLALQKSDEVIGNVLSKIDKKANFTIMFTGKEPSVKFENEVEHRRMARSLKQNQPSNNTNNAKFFATDCVILYLYNDVVLHIGNDSHVLKNSVSQDPVGDCMDTTDAIFISYKEPFEGMHKVKLGLQFDKFYRTWSLSNATLVLMKQTISLKVNEVDLYTVKPMSRISLQKSYACSRKLVLLSDDTSNQMYKVTFNNIQVQAFIKKGQMKFSHSWNCIGFFTIPIWMGIFSGVVLTMILLVGMFMISEIKTMDRFDDPKGKHLMVAGSD